MRTTGRRRTGRAPRLLLLLLALASAAAPPATREALALPACGDGTGSAGVGAADALLTLKKAVGQAVTCPACACDVNADASVTAADALTILKRAVGSLRYLSCIADSACATPSPRIDALAATSAAAGSLVEATGAGFAAQTPTLLRFFGGGLSVEVPAVVVETGRVSAAAPPLASGIAAPAGGFRVQALRGVSSPVPASNVLTGLSITSPPSPPMPRGRVTADFLLGAVERADELLDELPPGDDMTAAVSTTREALADLHAEVVALRDQAKDSVHLGTRDGAPLLLTRDHLAQVDAMILASLAAQSAAPDSATPKALRVAAAAAGTDCRQAESAAYVDALLHSPETVTERRGYFTATCAAEASKTSYAVVLGSGALAVGILALTGATATGVALALPAAALLYVSVAGAGGLVAVGGALSQTSDDAVALVKQGVAQAESTMQSLVAGYVLPGVTGTLYDMAGAVKDLSEAFQLFEPTPPTTLPPTSTSTTSTDAPPACWCCCAFWDGCPPCSGFTCRELGSPQSPPDNEAVCIPYNQDFCDSDFCESP